MANIENPYFDTSDYQSAESQAPHKGEEEMFLVRSWDLPLHRKEGVAELS